MINCLTDGDDFLNSYLTNKKYIYLTSITQEYVDMTRNWYESLGNINSKDKALVVALDKTSYIQMQHYNIPSVYLESNIKTNISGEEWIEVEKATKLLAPCYIFKKYNIELINSDVDIVFFKDPYFKIKNEIKDGYNLAVMSDRFFQNFISKRKKGMEFFLNENKKEIMYYLPVAQNEYGIENGGFSFVKNFEKTKILKAFDVFHKNSSYFENFPKGKESGSLQTLTIKRYKEANLKVKVLNCFEFVNGSLWEVSYLRDRVKDDCYLVHHNFCYDLDPIIVRDKKTQKMKKYNHWYL